MILFFETFLLDEMRSNNISFCKCFVFPHRKVIKKHILYIFPNYHSSSDHIVPIFEKSNLKTYIFLTAQLSHNGMNAWLYENHSVTLDMSQSLCAILNHVKKNWKNYLWKNHKWVLLFLSLIVLFYLFFLRYPRGKIVKCAFEIASHEIYI